MQLSTLLFACMALPNFSKAGAVNNGGGVGHGRDGNASRNPHTEAGAMNNGGGVGHGRDGNASQNPHTEAGAMNNGGEVGHGRDGNASPNPHTEVGAMSNDERAGHGRDGNAFQNSHPDLAAWAIHGHIHPTEIQNPFPGNALSPQKQILISKMVNGSPADWHLIRGELVPDLRIASCNGPHGYAIVDISDSERLYACLKPFLHHDESMNREHSADPPVFFAVVSRAGMRRLEADLTPEDARSTLNSRGLLYHGDDLHRRLGLQPVGHVRYIKSDEINVGGDLYKY